jgi:hypothetical protein
MVLAIGLYSCATWKTRPEDIRQLDALHTSISDASYQAQLPHPSSTNTPEEAASFRRTNALKSSYVSATYHVERLAWTTGKAKTPL